MGRPRKVIPAPVFSVAYEIREDMGLSATISIAYNGREFDAYVRRDSRGLSFSSHNGFDKRGHRTVYYSRADKAFVEVGGFYDFKWTAWTRQMLKAVGESPEFMKIVDDMADYAALVEKIQIPSVDLYKAKNAEQYLRGLVARKEQQVRDAQDEYAKTLAEYQEAQAIIPTREAKLQEAIRLHASDLRKLTPYKHALLSPNKNTRLMAMKILGESNTTE